MAAMKGSNSSSEVAGPSAFEIKLGISTGRNSPEPEIIMVNAETTVNWIFIQGAYVLSHIHGRDRDSLQKDFDLYLLRPGRDDIVLNEARVIADYRISRNDVLQLRHKTLPIPINVDLCEGDIRQVEVNSGFPLLDIIPVICQELGVNNYQELSLALPSRESGASTMRYEWLDRLSTLHGQGVQKGDTVLLRKKFFILNEDIQEALEGNNVLMELIYQQTRNMFTRENYVGFGEDSISSCSKLSALYHHIEQKDENISDEDSVCKVMPQYFQKNSEFYSQTVTNYYGQRVGTLEVEDAKQILIKYFCGSQSIIVSYFPVKKSEEDLVLLVDSDRIKVCQKTDNKEQLKVLDGMSWRLRDLREAEHTSQRERHLRVNILGSWYEFETDHRIQIARYLMEAQALTKLRVAKGRMSTAVTSGIDIVGEIRRRKLSSSLLDEEAEEESAPKPMKSPLTPLEPIVIVERQSMSDIEEDEKNVIIVDGSIKQREEVTAEVELDDMTKAANSLPKSSSNSPPPSSSSNTASFTVPPPPPSLATTPHHSSPPKAEGFNKAMGVEASPAKSDLGSKSMTVHIPEFLGLDFREVLEDFRLFHVVVMKQDVRIVLLNIKKPVQEVVDSLCATFDIPNPSGCYLWIPTGIQNIIEKYGGKPKNRAGKFLRQHQNGRNFAPRLDVSKNLDEQYNLTIKPFLLHLRRYQPQEGVDAAVEETDCGQEWPEFEHPDVARYRSFYQSWTGIVQGVFPIERLGAVKLAGMLTQVYYGDWNSNWPPRDYDAKVFLAEKHKHSFGIISEVEKVHRSLLGKNAKECINEVVEAFQQLPTMRGVFFEVAVPVKSEIFSVIPWHKMEQRWFGINQNGVFSIDRNTEEVNFTRKLSDISKWSATENSFKLTFSDWAFDAYTYQTKEILDTLELFVQMSVRKGGGTAVHSGSQVVHPEPANDLVVSPTEAFNGEGPLKPPRKAHQDAEECSPSTYSL